MDLSSVAEQRATAVAKLKRAASLPRMKDGRRPPMHVEAVSEGERVQDDDAEEEDSAQEDGKADAATPVASALPRRPELTLEMVEVAPAEKTEDPGEAEPDAKAAAKDEDEGARAETPAIGEPERASTPSRSKRRSRSRTRSRGSKDLKKVAKQSPHVSSASHTNESSADEYYNTQGEDPPPSPPLLSPIPSHSRGFLPASPLLRSPPLLYPGTTPSTPLPSLDQIQRGMMGLQRSNSAGAARMMAMSKLTGGTEPPDMSFISRSPTPSDGPGRLMRNNTVSGGERMEARRLMLHRLNSRIRADGEQTSGGEEATPTLSPKRRRRRSKRASSRASTVVDDREEKELPSTRATTPSVPSALPPSHANAPEPPRSASSMSRLANGVAGRTSPFQTANGSAPPVEYGTPVTRRSLVVEEEDDIPERSSPLRRPQQSLPTTPARNYPRLPHTSDAPSNGSADSPSTTVPVYLSRNASLRPDAGFPASPVVTPLRKNPYPDDDEQVLYQERSKSRAAFERNSEISWNADLVRERSPFRDDEEDEDDIHEADGEDAEEEVPAPADEPQFPRYEHVARPPAPQHSLVVDIETSPETHPSHIPPSPASPLAMLSAATDSATGGEASPVTYPIRLSVAASNQGPSQVERSPSGGEYAEWEDQRATLTDSTVKRAGPWEKVKNVMSLSRSGSTGHRRSRTNSIGIADRRNHKTDSSVSRESGASSKEKADVPSAPGPSSAVHSPAVSASPSMLSLHPPTPISMSPQPLASFDMAKYADSKLFPFPGFKQLEEQRRNKVLTPSSSTPDVVMPNGMETTASWSSSSTTRYPDNVQERKLSHQASDSRLLVQNRNVVSPPPISSVPSSASQADYFTIQSQASTNTSLSGSVKLPMTREGVKRWLNAKKIFSSQPSAPSTPGAQSMSPPSDSRPRMADKKPSLSDLLLGRKDNGSTGTTSDWEDLGIAAQRGSPKGSTLEARTDTEHDTSSSTMKPPNLEPVTPERVREATSPPQPFDFSYPFHSPPDPPSSTTPDPSSSLDDFPTRSTSDSYSDTHSSSHPSPGPAHLGPGQGALVLDRLDEVLGRGSKSSLPAAMDDPPRKLILCSPVLQVSNANTVKDRFLWLFNDILVIAKPIVQDQDVLLDTGRPDPSEKKYVVKSVVRLNDLRFCPDRDEPRSKLNDAPMKHPVMRGFIHQFTKEPDQAVATLFGKTGSKDDPVVLGQLLFRAVDIDRSRLGEYLSRRHSRMVLKAFIDSFGLTGLRIDKALRVFLQSVNIPSKTTGQHSPLEHFLDAFASRWYEANASIVAYDKDLAMRLVRATVQLHEAMHGSIAQEPGLTGYPLRNIITRDFIEAFRRFDQKSFVSDELLEKIYVSIRRERLFQARSTASQNIRADIPITIKRPLPSRLTYRVQSEPIILRIPQPDPQLTIQLFGQDLAFDPPVLTFAKSAEAMFRVTGTALGSKNIVMWRSGPNALSYSSLPLSSPVMVERHFMRNTFQLAFLDHQSKKRKYMFSVDEHLIRHQWTVSLKQQIEQATAAAKASELPGPSSPHQKIHENLALRVLQQTLISSEEFDSQSAEPMSPVNEALAKLNGTAPRHHANGSISASRTSKDLLTPTRRRSDRLASHARSKSRSQVYHRLGAGRMELDLDDSAGDDDQRELSGLNLLRQEGNLWSGRDVEIVCRQNSSIPSLLAYLQGGHYEGMNGTLP